MNVFRHSLILIMLILPAWLYGQSGEPPKFELTGYVKSLTTVFNPTGIDTSVLVDNLIHNRLDFSWFASDNITVNVSMRNRLFFGESVKLAPQLYDLLADDLGFLDMTILWFNTKGLAAQSTFDRLNIDMQFGKWQIIAGRHRINWGVNLIWNPNDLFNTYSYFDFDYEERIGTDAVLARYYISETSSAELIFAPGDPFKTSTFAGRYKFLKWNYDFHVLGGYLAQQGVAGLGWAGDIKGAGFRGEMSLFIPGEELDLSTQFVGAFDIDYTFTNSIYIHASYLFNSDGINSSTGDYQAFFVRNDITAQTLSPAMHNVFAEIAYSFSPIVRGGFATWINPSDGSLFLGPTVDWALAENFQVLFNVQAFVGKEKTLFGGYGQFYYLRFRYSF